MVICSEGENELKVELPWVVKMCKSGSNLFRRGKMMQELAANGGKMV